MLKFSMKGLINEQGKTKPGTAEAGFIQDIPISRIKPSPGNWYSLEDIEPLAESIREIGLLHNLAVSGPDGEGNYELISGERRYRACKLLYESGDECYRTLPCKVDACASPAESELKLIFANATARELSDYEKTRQAIRIKELLQQMKENGHKFKGRIREIAAVVHDISPAQMARMESISKNLSTHLSDEFKAGNIGITAAYELSKLSLEDQNSFSGGGIIDGYLPDTDAKVREKFKSAGKSNKKAPIKGAVNKVTTGKTATQPPAAEYNNKKRETETLKTDKSKKNPLKAYVILLDKDGNETTYIGNLVMIAAVDTEMDEFTGAFSSGNGVTGLDYATLAKAVCTECLKRIAGDDDSIEIMRGNLSMLFTKGFL